MADAWQLRKGFHGLVEASAGLQFAQLVIEIPFPKAILHKGLTK